MFNHIQRTNEAGHTIGDLEWRKSPGATYEMHLDVESDYHRQGVGRSMLDELTYMVKGEEGMSIYSYSSSDNEKAYGFFSGVGFTPYLITGFYGRERNAYLWVKTVGAPK